MISMLLTFESFLILLRHVYIVLEFLQILAILVLVSYEPVLYKQTCKLALSFIRCIGKPIPCIVFHNFNSINTISGTSETLHHFSCRDGSSPKLKGGQPAKRAPKI